MGRIAIAATLIGLLAGTVWFAVGAWTRFEGPPMPASGYVALWLGVGFSLAVGFGLMALIFYSNRHGYDEPAQLDRDGKE